MQRQVEEVSAPAVNCLNFKALTEWHLGEIASSRTTMAEAIPLVNKLRSADVTRFAVLPDEDLPILWELWNLLSTIGAFAVGRVRFRAVAGKNNPFSWNDNGS